MIRIIITLVFLLVCVSTMVNAFINWEFKLPEPLPIFAPTRPPTKPPPPPAAFNPVKDSRYCDESGLSKIFSKRTQRAASLWPVNCLFPSIVYYQGKYQFMHKIYRCCKKCDFPTYTSCVKKHRSPNWRCPSDGVHCVLDCVRTHGPGNTVVIEKPVPGGDFEVETIGEGLGTGEEKVHKVPKILKCESVEKLSNGKTCIRRLCVPLKS